MACTNGATLVFASNHDETAKEHYRVVSRQLFFTRVVPTRRTITDHSCSNPFSLDGPVLIWANGDSYENIMKEIPCSHLFTEPSVTDDKRDLLSRGQMISSTEFWLSASERIFGEPSNTCVSSPATVEEEFVLPKNAIIDEAISAARLIYK
jgi:hypothetical protein